MWMNREGEHIIKLCKVEEIKIIKERKKNGSKMVQKFGPEYLSLLYSKHSLFS